MFYNCAHLKILYTYFLSNGSFFIAPSSVDDHCYSRRQQRLYREFLHNWQWTFSSRPRQQEGAFHLFAAPLGLGIKMLRGWECRWKASARGPLRVRLHEHRRGCEYNRRKFWGQLAGARLSWAAHLVSLTRQVVGNLAKCSFWAGSWGRRRKNLGDLTENFPPYRSNGSKCRKLGRAASLRALALAQTWLMPVKLSLPFSAESGLSFS